MYTRVLLTDDGSELARTAVPHAAEFAKAAGAAVLVLRVSHAAGTDRRHLSADWWSEHVNRDETGGTRPAERVEAEPPLSEVTAQLRDHGADAVAELVVKDDDVGEAIVDVASRLGCDLIVMSTHGVGGLRRAVLGSVADHVVRHARAAVLLCR